MLRYHLPMTPSTAHRRATPRPWLVYVLRCADDTLYTGCTNDLPKRLRTHLRGQVKYTRARLPVTVAYHEDVPDRSAALRRERAIKRLTRQQKLALLNTNISGTPGF